MDDLKYILDITSVIIQLGVLVVACKALQQIKVSKDSTKISSDISSAQYTGKLIKDFFNDTMPLINTFNKSLDEKSYVKFEKNTLIDFTKEEIIKSSKNIQDHFIKSAKTFFTLKESKEKNLSDVINAANSIESFANSYINKIANEKIAFTSLGFVLCNVVEKYYFFYCLVRTENKEKFNYFQNTIDLYNIWSTRIKKYKLESVRSEVDEEILNLKENILNPIGTDV